MSRYSKEARQYVQQVLDQHGAQHVVYGNAGSGNQKVEFTVAGHHTVHFFPCTPSHGKRAKLNMMSQLRRQIRNLLNEES